MERIGRELETMGFSRDEKGFFHLFPRRAVITREVWEKLSEGKAPPRGRVEECHKALQADFLEELSDRLYEKPSLLPVRQQIEDYLQEHTLWEGDAGDWLKAPVRVNLGVTVDCYSEYTSNVVYPAYDWPDYADRPPGEFDYASIMWLTRRQGYSRADLREAQYSVQEAVKEEDPQTVIPSRYLFTAAMEIWHELSIFNQLGFFVTLSLEELLLIREMQRWGKEKKKWQGYVLLDKGTRCGFFSTWDGSSSLLGIEMERDLKLPLSDIEAIPDGAEKFAIYDVIQDEEVWKSGCILHWGLSRQFRQDAPGLGFESLPPRGPYKC